MKINFSDGVSAVQIPTPGLGDHSYVLLAGRHCAIIDPQRDVDRFDKVVHDAGARPQYVVETHIHNDYVTGGHHLAAGFGVDYVLPAETGSRLPHTPADDGTTFPLGNGWSLEAIATPGHTPHHTSYALLDPKGRWVAVFSGGSMLVGSVGRTDLIGPEHTLFLTRAQFHSVRRLADGKPDEAVVLPTHGAGSFCSASDISGTTSTIGAERRNNPALAVEDEATFVEQQLAGLRLYPSYYSHMGEANKLGVAPMNEDPIPHLDPAEVGRLLEAGTAVVDVRDRHAFAASHIPGAVNIPFSDSVGVYTGWVLEWNEPVVIVAPDPGEAESARLQLARIGHDRVAGLLDGGMEAWEAAGFEVASYEIATFSEFRLDDGDRVIDVRDPLEAVDGMVAGAMNIHMSRIGSDLEPAPNGRTWLYCQTGYRASVAASLAAASGNNPVLIADDWTNYRGAIVTPA